MADEPSIIPHVWGPLGTMPRQRPGRSKQDYQTPPAFLDAVKRRLNIMEFGIDLAASDENAVASLYYTEEADALSMPWGQGGNWAWCNPPFGHIGPWVEKATKEVQQGAHIALLVPAAVGSKWWAYWVHNEAHVLLLRPRLTFVGCTAPYPKDCALLLYTPFIKGGYDTWRWK